MSQKIEFENHFSAKVIEIHFPEGYSIQTQDDITYLKQAWVQNLKMWHAPYTCLMDLSHLSIETNLMAQFERTVKFFSQFFMRKMVGYVEGGGHTPAVSFEVIDSYEAALTKVGLKGKNSLERNTADLRQRIVIENDFNAHVMEISFLADTQFLTPQDIETLKSKIRNILRQWHSPYSLLFNCINCTFSTEACAEFAKLERFLKGFFCKEILGYSPKAAKEQYPFKTFRSRHLAAAQLEHSGLKSGAVANCSTKKS